jgi:hypothetical protein
MNAFLTEFIKGARETPLGYFAPVLALWRLLVATMESPLEGKH